MDPPDKKRPQPTNPDSTATPSSGHPTAIPAAAALPSAAAAVAAPPLSAGRAVFAARRLSPAERCQSDPLSVAFSFLDLELGGFAAASRVCRHWRNSAEFQSAWPEFSVERLISSLIENESHWIQSRSVNVNADRLRVGALERIVQSSTWRRLTELHLNCFDGGQKDPMVPLGQVAQLPHLRSLHLERASRLADVTAAFSSLAPRLLALDFGYLEDAATVQSHVHLLVNLRVLELADVEVRALLLLHQLEYLQLRGFDSLNHNLLLAIRRLSVQHQLRHLSLSSYTRPAPDLDPLVAQLSGADSSLAPAALFSICLHCEISDASCSALLTLPNLTRLDWTGTAAKVKIINQRSSLPLSPLQQLHLSFSHYGGGGPLMLRQAAARAPQLSELRMSHLPSSFRQLIGELRSLRLLDIALSDPSWMSTELMQSLAALPLFSEIAARWSLNLHPPRPYQLTLDTLRSIGESRSFRLIRLIGQFYRPQITLPNDVGQQLAVRLADLRVHVEWRGRTTSYRLIISAGGTATWRQTVL